MERIYIIYFRLLRINIITIYHFQKVLTTCDNWALVNYMNEVLYILIFFFETLH